MALMTSVQNRYDQLYNDESSSRAHQESDEVFGLQNDNRYPQYVRRALHERSTNTQYENLYRLGAFDKSALLYPAKLPPSGPLVLDESAISVLSGWSSAYEKEFRIVWHQSWECKAFYEYRTANPKPDRVAKDEDKKWTPLREEMFFRGQSPYPLGDGDILTATNQLSASSRPLAEKRLDVHEDAPKTLTNSTAATSSSQIVSTNG